MILITKVKQAPAEWQAGLPRGAVGVRRSPSWVIRICVTMLKFPLRA